jgi:hypothetical protein
MQAVVARNRITGEFRPDDVKLRDGQFDELLTAYETRLRP